MAAKIGVSVIKIVDTLESLFETWKNKSSTLQARYSGGQPVSIDAFVNAGYYAAKGSLTIFDAMQARITEKGWAQAVRDEAILRHGAGYDIVAEALALRTLLSDLQTTITTAIGIDGNGYISVPYIRLANTGLVYSTVAAVDYAPINTKLAEIAAALVD